VAIKHIEQAFTINKNLLLELKKVCFTFTYFLFMFFVYFALFMFHVVV